jgi:uncharacterized protein (TIGR02118 family)
MPSVLLGDSFSRFDLIINSKGLTMVKLTALYRKPDDPEQFDQHYFGIHTPLVRKYPNLKKLELTRITGAPIGDTKFNLMAEMYWETKLEMDAALISVEGKAVAKDLMSFGAQYVTLFSGDVFE